VLWHGAETGSLQRWLDAMNIEEGVSAARHIPGRSCNTYAAECYLAHAEAAGAAVNRLLSGPQRAQLFSAQQRARWQQRQQGGAADRPSRQRRRVVIDDGSSSTVAP
jgi:hypothetical protein